MCSTHRFEELLRRVAEYEGETEDNGCDGEQRCERVAWVENKQPDEDDDAESAEQHGVVEFCDDAADILERRVEHLALAVDPLNSFTHLALRDVTVAILVEQCERSMLDMVLSNPEPLKQEHEYVLRRPSSGSMDRSLRDVE